MSRLECVTQVILDDLSEEYVMLYETLCKLQLAEPKTDFDKAAWRVACATAYHRLVTLDEAGMAIAARVKWKQPIGEA